LTFFLYSRHTSEYDYVMLEAEFAGFKEDDPGADMNTTITAINLDG
jgi:hypothetical protein